MTRSLTTLVMVVAYIRYTRIVTEWRTKMRRQMLEHDTNAVARYLREVKIRNGAFSSFFVSERTRNYYTGEGILKRVSSFEPRVLRVSGKLVVSRTG